MRDVLTTFYKMATAKSKEIKTDPNRVDAKEQAKLFDEAMAKFLKRDFATARELFARSATGPNAAQAHSASMHVNMCDRRTSRPEAPKTAEENYTAGVASLNAGALDEAERMLGVALKGNANAGHYQYAMALCLGLKGDLEGCRTHLARSIELEPANRVAARNDPDFQSIARQSPVKELLHGEKAS